MIPRLIYCDGKNAALATIAIASGFEYGIRYPASSVISFPLTFVDVDWKQPNKEVYIQGIRTFKPFMASVIDITDMSLLPKALSWAEELAEYIQKIIIIPKIPVIDKLPLNIRGKEVLLGYSIPTSYGGTPLPIEDFLSFRVHLLGGSPHQQMRYFLRYSSQVYSIDGNYMTKMANKLGRFWVPGNNLEKSNRFWKRDLSYSRQQLFERSCKEVYTAWNSLEQDTSWLNDRRRRANT